MCRLFETIKIFERKIANLDYHNHRLNVARQKLMGLDVGIDLRNMLVIPEKLAMGLYRCRVVYDEHGFLPAEFTPYDLKMIRSLKIIHDDGIDYSYKYENRTHLDRLFAQRGDCDDILIIKNGLVTDTSICNIVFYDGEKWITPSTPLLKGTKRMKLLEEGLIIEDEIRESDIKKFKKACLINAFRDLLVNPVSIEQII
jgi:4-amino-4-deoxychorismate lyase